MAGYMDTSIGFRSRHCRMCKSGIWRARPQCAVKNKLQCRLWSSPISWNCFLGTLQPHRIHLSSSSVSLRKPDVDNARRDLSDLNFSHLGDSLPCFERRKTLFTQPKADFSKAGMDGSLDWAACVDAHQVLF